ncbi:hypothetical protein [Bdellovibrio bacteriovorus]|uniref:Lipoprotein n=1 Tax=Bdellovibrio bacteriovorus str. Tiberius TaxID=1069642 RepID=K7YQA8_BDEBC|nr:hypothetical protein [Bdellovibrio bacteriovorus]AFY02021.1 hypothetical protein Bdt_2338 [Bdellovibrio bacteriovorus str. Tiberius]
MQTSKLTILKAILSLYALSLAGCNLPSPQDKESTGTGAATFTAQPMADKSKALEVSVQGDFALPSSKVFNLQACIKDVAYDKVVAGHDFMVEETQQKVTTDKAGCLTWAERVSFNFLAESQYIRIERTIKGTGVHRGSQKVAYAINPWSHGETLTPVLNPDDGNNIPRLVDNQEQGKLALKGLSADNAQATRPLWVEDGRLFVTEQKMTAEGVTLLVEMRPNPSIQLTKMNGEMFLRALTAGSFKARMKLIHIYQHDNQEIRRQMSETSLMDVKMENGSLAIKSPMHLPALPTRGQIMLGLELSPVNGPQGLTAFDGVYFLGEYDQIKGSSFLKLNTIVAQTKGFKISNYVNAQMQEVAQVTPAGKMNEDTYQKPKIEVSQLEFRFIRVGSETTSTREVFYNIKACVRNGLDQKNTRAHTFKVTKFRQNEAETSSSVSLKTDNNSCLSWDESISFKYFDCQRYLKGYVQIENEDLGMKEKLEIIVNPWESWGQVARDMRYVDPTEKLILSCEKESRPRTQILLDSFSYNTLSYNYNVDAQLNLTVTKKIQFKMDPRLLIYSSLANGRAEAQKLRDGVYLMKLAIVQNRDYDQKNTYVTSADRFVNVMNGLINTDVTFQTQDLKALGNRNNILVELHPVDESKVVIEKGEVRLKDASQNVDSAIDAGSVLENPTFIGPITLNIDETTRPLRIMDPAAISTYLLKGKGENNTSEKNVVARIVAEGFKVKAEITSNIKNRSQAANFAKENNLDLLALPHLEKEQPLVKALVGSTNLADRLIVTKSDLYSLVSTGKLSNEAAQRMCAFWASDYMRKMYAAKGGAIMPNIAPAFGMDCFHAVKKDASRFFMVEKQMLIKEVGNTQYVKGLNQGLTVGTSFSLSASHSKSVTTSTSVSAKIGLSKKFMDLLSVSADLGYTMSWATTDAKASSNSISVNGSTSMTVQQSQMKVRVNKYEQCAIVRLNPTLFIKDTKSWFGRKDYLSVLNSQLTEAEKAAAVTRGIMVCDGVTHTEPVDITENYYLIAQETSSSQMQDSGDSRNRNFFIALRSTQDFNRFVIAMRGNAGMPQGAEKDEDPQVQATKMMEQLFQMPAPSYPGMYLVK